MRKRSDPFRWMLACYLIALAVLVIAKLWIVLSVVVLLSVAGVFVYAWLLLSYWPRKHLIDQAEKYKPDEYPDRDRKE